MSPAASFGIIPEMFVIFLGFFSFLVFIFALRPQKFGRRRRQQCGSVHRVLVVLVPDPSDRVLPLFIQQSHLINLNQFANVFIYMENPLDKQGLL